MHITRRAAIAASLAAVPSALAAAAPSELETLWTRWRFCDEKARAAFDARADDPITEALLDEEWRRWGAELSELEERACHLEPRNLRELAAKVLMFTSPDVIDIEGVTALRQDAARLVG